MQVNESRYYYPPLQNDYLNGVLLLYKEHSKKLKSLTEAQEAVGEVIENHPVTRCQFRLFSISIMVWRVAYPYR